MNNYAFRYLPDENVVSAEKSADMKRIFELPIEGAGALTDDELCEDLTEGRDE